MKLRTKFILPVSASLLFIILLSGYFSHRVVNRLSDYQIAMVEKKVFADIKMRVSKTTERLYQNINIFSDLALLQAVIFAYLPEVNESYQLLHDEQSTLQYSENFDAVKSQLSTSLQPVFTRIQKSSGMELMYLQLVLADGSTLMNTGQDNFSPEKTSQDSPLSPPESNLPKEKNKLPVMPMKGVEVSQQGAMVSGLIPITTPAGRYLGYIKILFPFEVILSTLLSDQENQFNLFLDNQFESKLLKSKDNQDHPVLDGRYLLAMTTGQNSIGKEITSDFLDRGRSEIFYKRSGESYLVSFPITDSSGNTIGVMVLKHDISDDLNIINSAHQRGEEAKVFLLWSVGVGLLITFVLIFLILAFILSKTILTPLKEFLHFADNVANGDFTKQMSSNSDDEIGLLVHAINKIITSFNSVFGKIEQNIIQLSSTSNELTSISNQVLTASADTSQNAQSVADATEKMSVNMNTIASSGEEASTNIFSLSNSVSEMNETVKKIADNTRRASSITDNAVSLVTSSSDKVSALADAVKEIGQVTDEISAISEKTDLLALNATIEAARAGIAGKGFAVVANEVKGLAHRTANSTKTIQKKIKDIQESSDIALQNARQITDVIVEVNEIVGEITSSVDEQAITTREISENVNQAAEGIDEVAKSITQNSMVSTEIAKDIGNVSRSANGFTTSSSHINTNANDLAAIAKNLKEMLAGYKTSNQPSQVEHIVTSDSKEAELTKLIEWDDSLSVSIDRIDLQHQNLINLINQLHRSMKTGEGHEKTASFLEELINYTAMHFKEEEEMMERYQYPKFKEHQKAHQKLVEKVLDYKSRLDKGESFIAMELMDFLKEWLVKHIQGTDKLYSPFLLERL